MDAELIWLPTQQYSCLKIIFPDLQEKQSGLFEGGWEFAFYGFSLDGGGECCHLVRKSNLCIPSEAFLMLQHPIVTAESFRCGSYFDDD